MAGVPALFSARGTLVAAHERAGTVAGERDRSRPAGKRQANFSRFVEDHVCRLFARRRWLNRLRNASEAKAQSACARLRLDAVLGRVDSEPRLRRRTSCFTPERPGSTTAAASVSPYQPARQGVASHVGNRGIADDGTDLVDVPTVPFLLCCSGIRSRIPVSQTINQAATRPAGAALKTWRRFSWLVIPTATACNAGHARKRAGRLLSRPQSFFLSELRGGPGGPPLAPTVNPPRR